MADIVFWTIYDNLILGTMKRIFNGFVILLVLTMSSVIFPKQTSAQQSDVNFQVFYDGLSPYGEWVDYDNYGYVWIPDAGSDFVPYSTNGYWVLSNYGWTWVSDYEWGWAPFHYGRWDFNNYYGWFWIPDNVWGPAWVNWRQGNGYYGWSPMEPGISLSLSFGRPYNRDNDHWMFVRDRDFERHDINRYYVNRTDHDRIIRNSTVIRTTHVDNNRHTTYVTGPARRDVQRVTGRQIKPVSIRENTKPGQQMSNGQLHMYRPQINKNNDRERKAAPSRITNLKDVKRPSERSGANRQRNATPANNSERQQQGQQPQRQQQQDAQQQRQQQQRKATPANNSGRQQQQGAQQRQQQKAASQRQEQKAQQQRQQQQATQQQQQQKAQQQRQAAQQQQQRQQQQGAQQQQKRQQQQAAQQKAQQQQQGQQQQRQAAQQQRQQKQRSATPAKNARQQQRQQPAATPDTKSADQPKESKKERGRKRND